MRTQFFNSVSQTHAFYDEEVNGIFVGIFPEREPIVRSLETPDARFAAHLTPDGHLEGIEYLQERAKWQVDPRFRFPSGDIYHGERIWNLQEKLKDPIVSCDPTRRALRIEFPEHEPELLVATGDSLIVGVSADGFLARVWILHIIYDYKIRKRRMLGYLKTSEASRERESESSS